MPRMSNYGLDIRIWDVAHGSAVYMRAGNKDVVLDAGSSDGFSPLQWLNTPYYGMNAIDYLIISHPHEDHIADLDLMRDLDLNNAELILQRPKEATPLLEENLKEARREEKDAFIEDAEYYLNVLDEFDQTPDIFPSNPKWAMPQEASNGSRQESNVPERGVTFHNYSLDKLVGSSNHEKLNNLSRVTLVNCFGFEIVSMGDILQSGLNEIKDDEETMSAIKNVDVLIAPHHGRESSFDSELVKHINPELVVFSDKNAEHTVSEKYGPLANGKVVHNEQTETLQERKVVSTNSDGRIRIQANNGDEWKVRMYGRDYAKEKGSTKRYQKAD